MVVYLSHTHIPLHNVCELWNNFFVKKGKWYHTAKAGLSNSKRVKGGGKMVTANPLFPFGKGKSRTSWCF